MSATWRSLLRDERGFVITAELVLISTILVLGLVAALSAVKTALAAELSDVAGAIGSLNQSYYTHGFHGCGSRVVGSSFLDQADSSDELKADFATGLQSCPPVIASVKTDCRTPGCAAPCNPPCNPPCTNPPCNGCGTTLQPPTGLPIEAPCGTPCNTPCGTAIAAPCGSPCATAGAAPCGGTPCGGSPCASAPCGTAPCGAGYGGSSGGCGGSSYLLIDGWSRFGASVPPVVCPPGPGPFTGTDPFAPGVVSPQNMLLQGISYGGVCAPPAAPPQLEAPPRLPAPPQAAAAPQPCPQPPVTAACCESPAGGPPQISMGGDFQGPDAGPVPLLPAVLPVVY
jgi:Flp pilus assembly pilin Flp